VRGTKLKNQLILGTEVNLLQVLALVQILEVQLVAVFAAEKNLRNQPVLEGRRQAPLAGDQRVVAQVRHHAS